MYCFFCKIHLSACIPLHYPVNFKSDLKEFSLYTRRHASNCSFYDNTLDFGHGRVNHSSSRNSPEINGNRQIAAVLRDATCDCQFSHRLTLYHILFTSTQHYRRQKRIMFSAVSFEFGSRINGTVSVNHLTYSSQINSDHHLQMLAYNLEIFRL